MFVVRLLGCYGLEVAADGGFNSQLSLSTRLPARRQCQNATGYATNRAPYTYAIRRISLVVKAANLPHWV